MLYSRAGTYPAGQPELHGEAFRQTVREGACARCHGIGRVYDATEKTMVPDDSLTIRQRAIAAWPPAWGGQNQRDISGYAWLRCRSSLARTSQEGSGLDSFYRGPAHCAGICRIHSGGNPPSSEAKGGAELPRDIHRRPALSASYLGSHRKRAHPETGAAIPGRCGMSGLSGKAPAARVSCRLNSLGWILRRSPRCRLRV